MTDTTNDEGNTRLETSDKSAQSACNGLLCGFISAEIFQTEKSGHKYNIGETRTLVGLESYPLYNGTTVVISSYRDDGEFGKAYYVQGAINEYLNWVYEYRLT